MGHGPAVRRLLIALANVRVEAHTRTSSSGRTVNVRSYMRSVKDMTGPELAAAAGALKSHPGNAEQNQYRQVLTEQRMRMAGKSSAPAKKFQATATVADYTTQQQNDLRREFDTEDQAKTWVANLKAHGGDTVMKASYGPIGGHQSRPLMHPAPADAPKPKGPQTPRKPQPVQTEAGKAKVRSVMEQLTAEEEQQKLDKIRRELQQSKAGRQVGERFPQRPMPRGAGDKYVGKGSEPDARRARRLPPPQAPSSQPKQSEAQKAAVRAMMQRLADEEEARLRKKYRGGRR